MRLPWGKHRGEKIADVPLGYLAWLWEESNLPASDKEQVRREIIARLGGSAGGNGNTARTPPPRQDTGKAERVGGAALAALRKLALVCHPDRGGSHDAMVAVNNAREEVSRAMQ